MILILSIERELTTQLVIEWCWAKKQNPIVVNTFNSIVFNRVVVSNSIVKIEIRTKYDDLIYDNQSYTFWHRKGVLFFDVDIKNQVNRYKNNLVDEVSKLSEFLLERLKQNARVVIGRNVEVNKLDILVKACEFGLNVPDTTVLKTDLFALHHLNNIHTDDGLINKNISEAILSFSKKNFIHNKTSEVSVAQLLDTDLTFPTQFQQKVDKKFELRVFYLDGIFYSMAIFSQLDSKTSIDFRNYNFDKPNRTVPYELPLDIKKRLIKLVKNMDGCSIDIIVDKADRYYFLEVNPVGQFTMVSEACNYYLEEKVANYLCQIH